MVPFAWPSQFQGSLNLEVQVQFIDTSLGTEKKKGQDWIHKDAVLI